jgi:4-hydroxybenzoate polyprenyltransferase
MIVNRRKDGRIGCVSSHLFYLSKQIFILSFPNLAITILYNLLMLNVAVPDIVALGCSNYNA